MQYFRPLAQTGAARPDGAMPLAGTASWFTHVECRARGTAPQIVPAQALEDADLAPFITARPSIAGLDLSRPVIMGILNVTPDSFSDGGQHNAMADAVTAAEAMVAQGAHLIDIGGESTRPGAAHVANSEEIARTAPVIAALSKRAGARPISIDTRKADVAAAALAAGAALVNDVSGLTFDPALAALCAEQNAPVCIMHAQGLPETMQDDPHYEDVVLDVYDFLQGQIEMAVAKGVARERIIVDPGIGFGKSQSHNLALLPALSLFHGLGCPILLGVSRKKFIGSLGGEQNAANRAPGSIAVALDALRQGAHILRVHDVDATRQAVALWMAVTEGGETT